MGNHRFRLSYMMPNAWFYKLRDMNSTTAAAAAAATSHGSKALPSAYSSASKQQQKHPRNSVYYTPRVHQIQTSPTPTSRKSLTRRNTIRKPGSPRHALTSPYTTQPTESPHTDQDLFLSPANYESPSPESTRSFHTLSTTSCNCRTSTDHIVIDFHDKPSTKKIQDSSGFDLSQEIGIQKLPPITTKSKNSTTSSLPDKKDESCSDQKSVSVKESISKKETPARKPVSRMKMRSNAQKRNFSENCVIVKSSFDPQKDLKESMVEMIVDNNIWESKDLEKLLAWYLSLNSDEYHDMIITAFEQIWLTFESAV